MKTTTKTITREYDTEGRLVKETEVLEEKISNDEVVLTGQVLPTRDPSEIKSWLDDMIIS